MTDYLLTHADQIVGGGMVMTALVVLAFCVAGELGALDGVRRWSRAGKAERRQP